MTSMDYDLDTPPDPLGERFFKGYLFPDTEWILWSGQPNPNMEWHAGHVIGAILGGATLVFALWLALGGWTLLTAKTPLGSLGMGRLLFFLLMAVPVAFASFAFGVVSLWAVVLRTLPPLGRIAPVLGGAQLVAQGSAKRSRLATFASAVLWLGALVSAVLVFRGAISGIRSLWIGDTAPDIEVAPITALAFLILSIIPAVVGLAITPVGSWLFHRFETVEVNYCITNRAAYVSHFDSKTEMPVYSRRFWPWDFGEIETETSQSSRNVYFAKGLFKRRKNARIGFERIQTETDVEAILAALKAQRKRQR